MMGRTQYKFRTCFGCGERIKGKMKNSLYCGRCGNITMRIGNVANMALNKYNKRYKIDELYDYKVSVRIIKKR